jgi:hypothetical protein
MPLIDRGCASRFLPFRAVCVNYAMCSRIVDICVSKSKR